MKQGGKMKQIIETEVADTSRRNLLKKAYVAPIVVALGSMAFTTQAQAGWFKKHAGKCFFGCGCPSSGGSSSSSSVSGGGGWCSICKHNWPCSHHK